MLWEFLPKFPLLQAAAQSLGTHDSASVLLQKALEDVDVVRSVLDGSEVALSAHTVLLMPELPATAIFLPALSNWSSAL